MWNDDDYELLVAVVWYEVEMTFDIARSTYGNKKERE